MSEEPKLTRRDFLTHAGRYGLALLIGGGAAHLARRDRETCINNSRCRGCGRIEGCHLPAAVSTRQAIDQEHGNG